MSLPEDNQKVVHNGGNPGPPLGQGDLGYPERSALDVGMALALCAVSILFLWPFTNYTGLYSDEGIIVQGAERILRGEVPYRDFFTFYTPLSYYWTALRLRVFGNSFFVARAILPVYGGAFSMVIYLVARRVCSRDASILTAYLFLATGLPHCFNVLHNWDGAFWAALAFYAAVRWLQSGSPFTALATGTLASLTARLLAIGLGLPAAKAGPWWARMTGSPRGLERARVLARLRAQEGKHLVLVRYSPYDRFVGGGAEDPRAAEWVYNEADIDRAKVVWARDMGPAENQEILAYYKDRRVWLVEPDKKPVNLAPYPTP